MIRQAKELVNLGEKALVVFTRDMHFEYDGNGAGYTGYWKTKDATLAQIDKVIVYVQYANPEKNKVYMGNYSHWVISPEPPRKYIHFTALEDKGITTSNWFEFGGNAWSPTFYIPKVGVW